ncbi:MAG: hypothetical protein MK119_13320 [Kordia sp.]|nr:hypothetical protein [Kordia sp.]
MDFFTIMIILITLVVFVFIVLIAFVMKKSKDVKNEGFLEAERKEMLQNVVKKRKKLIPHKAEYYLQITDAMTFQRIEDVRSIRISGLLYNTSRKPIVAFERVERGKNATGQLVALTKKQEFIYEFLGLDISIICDGELLGTWDSKGILNDANKKTIGKLQRTQETNTLSLHDRNLASIKKAPLYDHIAKISEVSEVFEGLNNGTSLLTLNDTPNTEEENWVLALGIFEIAFYGNTTVN